MADRIGEHIEAASFLETVLVVDGEESKYPDFHTALDQESTAFTNADTHRDDIAGWLLTTNRQCHRDGYRRW